MVKLTRRQEEFVRNLVALYRKDQTAVHYTELAERLGVSRFTAYDMLRLLEEKGLVASRYELDEARSGPGRSTIVYEPTAAAHALMSQLLGGEDDWPAIRERMDALVARGVPGTEELAREILARTPVDEEEEVAYCIEVMTVIALRLPPRERRKLIARFPRLVQKPACRIGLSLLSGFALGLLMAGSDSDEQTARDAAHGAEWQRELYDHLHRYQRVVLNLTPERCRRLAHHLEDAFAQVAAI